MGFMLKTKFFFGMRHLVLQNGRSPQANLSIRDFITKLSAYLKIRQL